MSRFVWIRVILLFIFTFSILQVIEADRKSIFSSSKRNGYSSKNYARRPSIQRGDLHVLFPTAAALGSLYIASRMRSRINPRSYRDLYDYTVCPGPKREYMDRTGQYLTYTHFLCPDDPNQLFERYCCRDTRTGEGVCCSYDELNGLHRGISKWAIIGGSIATLGILVMIALIIYCCCCANRCRKRGQPEQVVQPAVPSKPVTEAHAQPQPPGFVLYPMGPSPPTAPAVPVYAHPASYPMPVQPGSAWSTPVPVAGTVWQQSYQDPPPPYPGSETVPNKSSAPYPT